jgi:peptidoglycan/LPS O-acetylase OafA/YrhL
MARLTLADAAHGRDNNFHLVRLLAAVLVLVSHSWPLTGTAGEPLERWAGFSLGHLGVDVFFVVSGFLVTGSLFARPALGSFLRARALRILPALVVSSFGVAFVMGPLVTTLPTLDYLGSWDTWRYALRNAITWPLGVEWHLPGVFAGNPGGPAVNGALWSLPWELTMYALLVALGVLRLAGVGRGVLRALVLATACAATVGHAANEGWALTQRFELVQGLRLTALFFTGGALRLLAAAVPLHGAVAAAALLALAVVMRAGGAWLGLYPALLGYAVLWFALVPGGPLRAWRKRGDWSYGLYLWQFPVQQCLMGLFPGLGPAGLIATALPATLVLAIASWRFVEAPALARKDR